MNYQILTYVYNMHYILFIVVVIIVRGGYSMKMLTADVRTMKNILLCIKSVVPKLCTSYFPLIFCARHGS